MKRVFFVLTLVSLLALNLQAGAACTPTGFFRDGINMTALIINPTDPVANQTIDASGCNIAIYIDNVDATVDTNDISGANYFGVVVNGDVNTVSASYQQHHSRHR